MHDIMPDPPPATETTRSLHTLCEQGARLIQCPHCGQKPGRACSDTRGMDGYHVARFAAARRRGLISGADFTVITDAAEFFTNATIVYDAPDGAR